MLKFVPFYLSITIVIAWISGSFLYGDTQDLNPMEVSALRLESAITKSKLLIAKCDRTIKPDKKIGAIEGMMIAE
mgnify:CR=1 FL=1